MSNIIDKLYSSGAITRKKTSEAFKLLRFFSSGYDANHGLDYGYSDKWDDKSSS